MKSVGQDLGALNQFSFYRDGSSAFQKTLRELVQPVHLERGAYYYREGDTCPHFALVTAGSIRVVKTAENGRQITLYHVVRGETCLVNIMCALLDTASPVDARTESDVDAFVVPSSVMRTWMREHPVFQNYVVGSMSMRLLHVMTLFEQVLMGRLDQRLAAFLLSCFVKGGGARLRELETTHEDIALELGSSREVISRILEDFQRRGVVVLSRGRIALEDEEALRLLASGYRDGALGTT